MAAYGNDNIPLPPYKGGDIEYIEAQEPARARTYTNSNTPRLTPEHHAYLIQRHGTTELDPLPSHGDADPYNWPEWKKVANLMLVAVHALMGTFTAAAIIPAYEEIADEFGTVLQNATYLTSIQIAILGIAPLIWKPISARFGRRPIFLVSLVFSLLGNIACARSMTYGTMAGFRAVVAFFISPAGAIGSGVVAETFFKNNRAKYMGIWTLLITLGVPVAPFVMGFVATNIGWRWILWVLAMINGVQLILYLLFGPETRYVAPPPGARPVHRSAFKQEYLSIRRIDPTPFTLYEFVQPLSMFRHLCILLPTVAYSMVFLFGSVLITVELPQLFAEKFGFNAQQLGLQFLGVILGSVIGEQLGGVLSDKWMGRRSRQRGGRRPDPEYRLWLSYPGFVLTIVGVIVFLVQTELAAPLHWNISPVIGIAIAGAGNQIVTTIMITYSVDCYPEDASSVGVFITFVRQMWGFIGPFWIPPMFENVGVAKSSIVTTILIVFASVIPTIFVQWRGQYLRLPHEMRKA